MRVFGLLAVVIAAISATIVGSAGFAQKSDKAGAVSVKGVHLCCGSCKSRAEEALKDLKGVTNANADLNTKVVSFKVDGGKAAEAAIKSLADHGFYGTATYDGKKLKYPESGVRKGTKKDSFTLTGLHLCCTACVTGCQKALEPVKGLQVLDIDRNEETVKVTGSAVDVTETLAALKKAGFFASVKKEETKK